MISSTSNNIVRSSSKWLQKTTKTKNNWLQKRGVRTPRFYLVISDILFFFQKHVFSSIILEMFINGTKSLDCTFSDDKSLINSSPKFIIIIKVFIISVSENSWFDLLKIRLKDSNTSFINAFSKHFRWFVNFISMQNGLSTVSLTRVFK